MKIGVLGKGLPLLPLLFLIFTITSPASATQVRMPWPDENPPGLAYPAPPMNAPAAGSQIFVSPVPPPVPLPQQPATSPLNNTLPLLNQFNKKHYNGKHDDDIDSDELADGYSSNEPWLLQNGSHGELEACGHVPQVVQAAFKEAMDYRAYCPLAARGPNQHIVINDFSSRTNTPYMYIYNLDGTCDKKTAVTYGNGVGPRSPVPCDDDGSHLTPPGFHLTGYHSSDSFPASQCLGMVGLEGQESVARGVLIHPAANPGTASSWGCAGVGPFNDTKGKDGVVRIGVKSKIGEGALVYNYFGDKSAAGGCSNTAGLGHDHKVCDLDRGGRKTIPNVSNGVSQPTPIQDSNSAK
jgi:hypothetical protein